MKGSAAFLCLVGVFVAGAQANYLAGGSCIGGSFGDLALPASYVNSGIANEYSGSIGAPLAVSSSNAFVPSYSSVASAPAVSYAVPAFASTNVVAAPATYTDARRVQVINGASAQSYSPLTIVAPGVSSCGPEPTPTAILPLRPVALPVVDSPIYALPSAPLPRPVVISNKCSCTKVVQKPQLFQRIIQARRNQRFLKRTYRPVTETIAYGARPRC